MHRHERRIDSGGTRQEIFRFVQFSLLGANGTQEIKGRYVFRVRPQNAVQLLFSFRDVVIANQRSRILEPLLDLICLGGSKRCDEQDHQKSQNGSDPRQAKRIAFRQYSRRCID